MDARRVPGLVRCIKDNRPKQPDLEQLALNEDGNINEAIKNHSLVGKYGPWLRASSKGKKHGGKSSKWEHVNLHPNQEIVPSANDFGQCGQDATGISKDKPKSPPLRSEGDEEEANVNPKHINEEFVILKSQETMDYESTLDTSLQRSMDGLSIKSKGNFVKNGLLKLGAIAILPKVTVFDTHICDSLFEDITFGMRVGTIPTLRIADEESETNPAPQ
ncbi:hypothetical protein V6N11_024702 [Hibiscus sabdariffa]|uniref:Uncharacterized protein n=1 Tax=Hibiscus sabdariffa TaxID=183260 RepID=A0ABR2QMW4_9ROSI